MTRVDTGTEWELIAELATAAREEGVAVGWVAADPRGSHLPWSAGMLDGPIGRIGDAVRRVIDPRAQLGVKESVPAPVAGRARRDKDRDDLTRLREALRGR